MDTKYRLLDAALPNVPFDGWSGALLANLQGFDPDEVRRALPGGARDLAILFHRQGDAELRQALADADLSDMKIREKVVWAVRRRFEIIEPHRDAVARAVPIFAMPNNLPLGTKLVWETADVIWTGIGDISEDYNWYSKRATLSAVYHAVLLFWLGDDTEGHADSWAFLERRIEDVMRMEHIKGRLRALPQSDLLLALPRAILGLMGRPGQVPIPFPGPQE